jgi:hypothetical protein
MTFDDYYERVANMLARMEDGDRFSIRDKVRAENRERFVECFKWYAGATADGPYWYDWDDEKMVITKYEKEWLKEMKRGRKRSERGVKEELKGRMFTWLGHA